jgi:hypothetical protein
MDSGHDQPGAVVTGLATRAVAQGRDDLLGPA